MDPIQILGYFGAFLVGLILGLIGSGGSILSLPILVYLFGINPVLATAYSLFIVGITSLIGSIKNLKSRGLKIKGPISPDTSFVIYKQFRLRLSKLFSTYCYNKSIFLLDFIARSVVRL